MLERSLWMPRWGFCRYIWSHISYWEVHGGSIYFITSNSIFSKCSFGGCKFWGGMVWGCKMLREGSRKLAIGFPEGMVYIHDILYNISSSGFSFKKSTLRSVTIILVISYNMSHIWIHRFHMRSLFRLLENLLKSRKRFVLRSSLWRLVPFQWLNLEKWNPTFWTPNLKVNFLLCYSVFLYLGKGKLRSIWAEIIEGSHIKCQYICLIFPGLWHILFEVVAALYSAEGSIKRQWLIDAVEISCVSSFPSTVVVPYWLFQLIYSNLQAYHGKIQKLNSTTIVGLGYKGLHFLYFEKNQYINSDILIKKIILVCWIFLLKLLSLSWWGRLLFVNNIHEKLHLLYQLEFHGQNY